MAGEDRARWDRRHATADGLPEPAPPDALSGHQDLLPPAGRALDVACGRGAAAVWLAGRGLAVDAVDVSPVALRTGAGLAAAHRVAQAVRWWHHDLDDGLPPGLAGAYQVVVCQRFRDPRRYPDLAGALAPGGLLAVTVLSRVGGDGPFRAEPGELAAAFSGLRVLAHREGDGEASLLARAP